MISAASPAKWNWRCFASCWNALLTFIGIRTAIPQSFDYPAQPGVLSSKLRTKARVSPRKSCVESGLSVQASGSQGCENGFAISTAQWTFNRTVRAPEFPSCCQSLRPNQKTYFKRPSLLNELRRVDTYGGFSFAYSHCGR